MCHFGHCVLHKFLQASIILGLGVLQTPWCFFFFFFLFSFFFFSKCSIDFVVVKLIRHSNELMNNFTQYSLNDENDTVLCVCVCACVRARVSTNINVHIMLGKLCCSEIFIGLLMCFSRREWRSGIKCVLRMIRASCLVDRRVDS